VLVEEGEVEQRMKRESDDLDVQAIGVFIISSSCRQGLISSYLDSKQVECSNLGSEAAGCDQCREGAQG
jgi:hypothetical protein